MNILNKFGIAPKNPQKELNNILQEVKLAFERSNVTVPFFIAGGSVCSTMNGTTDYGDVDVYFYSLEDYETAFSGLEKTYDSANVTFLHHVQPVFLDAAEGVGLHKSDNAATFSGFLPGIRKDLQLIKLNVGTPEEIFETFDIVQSMCAITSSGEVIREKPWSKNLKLNFDNVDANSLDRVFKYVSIKGVKDPGFQETHKLYDFFIDRAFQEFTKVDEHYKDVKKVLGINVVSHNYNFHQYVHDQVLGKYDELEQVDLFEKMDVYKHFNVTSESVEYYISLINARGIDDARMRLSLEQIDEARDMYPEYFL